MQRENTEAYFSYIALSFIPVAFSRMCTWATWRWTPSTESVSVRTAGQGRAGPACPEMSAPPHMVRVCASRKACFFLMGRLSNRGFSFVILLTEVVVSDLRSVHAPVASHAARRHGCVRHRAGPVVAARRERGQRARASLPGGLHQVSPGQLISRALVLLLRPSPKPLPCRYCPLCENFSSWSLVFAVRCSKSDWDIFYSQSREALWGSGHHHLFCLDTCRHTHRKTHFHMPGLRAMMSGEMKLLKKNPNVLFWFGTQTTQNAHCNIFH